MATSSDGLLAPPSSTAKKGSMNSPSSTSSDSASDSGRSSPNSSGCESPLSAFDRALDSTDPLSFLMNSVTNDMLLGGESSAEDSIFSTSTPPSTHDSPLNEWPTSGMTKNAADMLWTQPDISTLSFDDFNNSMNLMGLPLDFDPMLFPPESLIPSDPSVMDTNPHALFPFAFGSGGFPDLNLQASDSPSRGQSATSSSSSSVSSSPAVESSQPTQAHQATSSASASTQIQQPDTSSPSPEQLMQELAQRAKQIVGLTMAMPIKPSQLGYASKMQKQVSVPPAANTAMQQLQPLSLAQQQSIDIPTQKPSSPQSSPISPTPLLTPTSGKTKTSHTTIERRYRTNLNSRIQSLRAAVPALRVLEVKAGNRVGNLSLKAGTRRVGVDVDASCDQEDVVDERGFVDGVKVARKGSKANVLGKAVEYIRVLKKREHRLKREQEGLKALIRSLVGGPELVQQWEAMWRERFGGPEKDEVEGEDAEADDENEDDDDDMDDKDDDETSGKKRKRLRLEPLKQKGSVMIRDQTTQNIPIMPAQAPIPLSIPQQTEKRKRGRPRKIPIPTIPIKALTLQAQQQLVKTEEVKNDMKMEVDQSATHIQPQQPQNGQFLLAAFAFFSFFNSPVLSTWNSQHGSQTHTHHGSVLGDPRPDVHYSAAPVLFGWRDVTQIIHLVVSLLLLVTVAAPWVPGIARYIPRAIKPLLGGAATQRTRTNSSVSESSSDDEGISSREKADWKARMVLLSALRRGRTLAPEIEAQELREALELSTGIWGLIMSLTRQLGSPRKSRSRFGLERRMLEQRAFMRLAELVALDANAPLTTRIQTYTYAFKFISIFSAPVADIATLALIIRPVWRAKSVSLWNLALNRVQGKDSLGPHVYRQYEKFVLESMSVDEAAQRIETLGRNAIIRPLGYTRPASNTAFSDSDTEEDLDSGYSEPTGPLSVLARQAIREYIRKNAERVFLQTVPDDESIEHESFQDEMEVDPEAAENEMRQIIAAGRALDQCTSTIVNDFEQVCNPTSRSFASDPVSKFERVPERNQGDNMDSELNSLLRAIVLYRRIFPSTLLSGDSRTELACSAPAPSISLTPMPSPPPSPSRKDVVLHLELRHALDSSAFDRGHALEDARDRVVDMLTTESSGWPKRLQNL